MAERIELMEVPYEFTLDATASTWVRIDLPHHALQVDIQFRAAGGFWSSAASDGVVVDENFAEELPANQIVRRPVPGTKGGRMATQNIMRATAEIFLASSANNGKVKITAWRI